MRKNVILVRRSTVALRSCNFSLELAGKLFLYMDKSSLKELCNVSNKWMNLSFCKDKKTTNIREKTTKIGACREVIWVHGVMDKSSLKEWCSISNKWMNLSLCKRHIKKHNKKVGSKGQVP